jgi:hypothetical protein
MLRAHGDALAVALHHDHVAVRLLFLFGVAGAFPVEIIGPGGEALRDPGQLGVADPHPGPVLDDLLGLPVSRGGQVEGGQGAHPHRVRVAGQDLPGVSGVQVLLVPVPVSHPGDPHGAEDAGQSPLLLGLHGPVPDPRGARDLRRPFLPGGVQAERGLQQPPLQLPALPHDRLLALPVVQVPRFLRRPGQQARELLRGIRQRRRQLPVHRGLAPVLQDPPHRHQQPSRHRAPPLPAVNDFRTSSRKRPRIPRTPHWRTVPDTHPEDRRHDRWPANMTISDAGYARKAQTLPTSWKSSRQKRQIISLEKKHPPCPVVLYFPAHSSSSPSQDQHGHSVPSTSAIASLVASAASSAVGRSSFVASSTNGVRNVMYRDIVD